MVGLSTAWFLQERGCLVTVLEAERVAVGASEGNAGWLTPGLAVPLPIPGILAYGIRAMASRNSPVHVPLWPDPHLRRFLRTFLRHCTTRRWRAGVCDYVPVNRRRHIRLVTTQRGNGLRPRSTA
jgi:D-amino-acid dehydrogenase